MDATQDTQDRLFRLIQQYAHACGRTATEVAHAVLASKTLRMQGYSHEQKGVLTERQARAAILLLDHWISKKGT